ncbi:MAG TPA: hypothetical protein VJH71_03090 [Candidatus Paceibacterota bacterium]
MNKIKLSVDQSNEDGKYYLRADFPLIPINNGQTLLQKGPLYFRNAFDSKEDAYEFGKDYFQKIGIGELDYE